MLAKMSPWLALVPLSVSLLCGVSDACAQMVLVSQDATLNTSIKGRDTDNIRFSDQKTWPAGDLSPMVLQSQSKSASHTAFASVATALSPNRFEAHISAIASFQQPNFDELALVSGNFSVAFDLLKASDAAMTYGLIYGGPYPNSTMLLFSVNDGVETLVDLTHPDGVAHVTLKPGHYVFRGTGSADMSAWYQRGSSTGGQGVQHDFVMTLTDLNPLAHGPYPDRAFLDAPSGPMPVTNAKITAPVGFGAGTVYFPRASSEGPFALVAITPGLLEKQANINWLAPLLASHGFVVVTVDTKGIFDLAASRSAQTQAAIQQVIKLSANTGSAFAGLVDPARVGVMGHATGSSLGTALANPQLLASIPLAPASATKDYAATKVPTMIVSCQNDQVAPVKTHANKFYDSLAASLPKALVEIKAGGNACTNSSTSAANKELIGKYAVSWLKRFLDKDTRYSAILCEAEPRFDVVLQASVLSAYKSNCPY
jgi:alpha-beta hydrolase superfamily lysophospholipase